MRASGVHAPATSFVGRDEDLGALAAMVAESRLVTLLGPPGVGKTRLAVEHAARASRPTWVCDVSVASNAEEVAYAVARTLDLTVERGPDAATAIGHQLATRGDALVVIDGLDLPAGPELESTKRAIEQWVGTCRDARVVVTSRRRLGVPGEAVFDVRPLAAPEGERLFLDRARAVSRSPIDGPELAAVARLIRELGGLPLAIELCAARARVLAPTQMLELLGSRGRQLTEPGSGAEAALAGRLWDAIESSYAQLGGAERSAFERCAAFRGAFDVDAAEHVLDVGTDGSAWTVDLLQTLVDASLLVTEDGPASRERRFRLVAPIRAFATERLAASGAQAETLWRHAERTLRNGEVLARALHGPDAAGARGKLASELDELLAVHGRAFAPSGVPVDARLPADLGACAAVIAAQLFRFTGPATTGLEIVDRAIASSRELPLDAELLVDVLEAKSRLLLQLGRAEEALVASERALAGVNADSAPARARVLGAVATALLARGRWRDARARFGEALDVARGLPDRTAEGDVEVGLGDTCFYEDDLDGALAHYQRALEMRQDSGDRAGQGVALSRIAFVEMERGAPDARQRFARALSVLREVGDRTAECMTTGYLAILEQEQGHLDDARARFESAIALATELGNVARRATFTGYLGACLFEMGRVDDARPVLEDAMRRHDELGDRASAALLRAILASLLATRDEIERARSWIDDADALLAGSPEQAFFVAAAKLHRGHLDLAIARAAAARGDTIRAGEHRVRARKRIEEAPEPERAQTDVRYALRTLARAIDAEPSAIVRTLAGRERGRLAVARGATWLATPAGETVDLAARPVLRRLVEALAEHRREHPGVVVGVPALVDSAWPDERLLADAALNRLRVALSTLRKLGLGQVLLTRPGGYLLDPDVPLEMVDT